MAHQRKVFHGSSRLCSCGCGRRKNPRRQFAPGCNKDSWFIRQQQHQQNKIDKPRVTGSGQSPRRPIKKEPRVAWTPEPNERYFATVNKVLRDFYFAELSQGEQCFIGSNCIRAPQGHRCFQIGDEVSVRLQRGTLNSSARWSATECHLVTAREYPEAEKGIVREWQESGTRGFVDRPCGCPIFVTVQIPELFIRPGDQVEVSSFALNKNLNKYFARAIRTED